MRPALVTALATALATVTATAQTEFWIDPNTGSDINPGSYAAPLRTLTAATALAGANDRIHMLAGIYGPSANGETLPITLGAGIPHNNLVIRGIGNVVFDLGGSSLPALRLGSGATGCRITNIAFINSDVAGWWTRVVNSGTGVNSNNAANNVEIDRCRFANVNRGIVLWTADNVQGWRIHDNLFWNCANDAILEYTGNNEIYNNTFYSGTWKAYISDSATSVCYNNLIVGYQIAFENNNALNNLQRYQNNWIHQCPVTVQGPGIVAGLPASNTVGTDPQLTNPTNGDFRPTPTSPVIDAGNPNIFGRADLDAVSRLVDYDQNGTLLPDIGAHELTPVALTVTLDTQNRILMVQLGGSGAGLLCLVAFCFDDGLVQVPGQGPILLHLPTLIPAYLVGTNPTLWPVNLSVVPPFVPGTRLVIQAFGLNPGIAALASNQVWVQV